MIDIEFYPDFWDEREKWPDHVNVALVAFLERLQANPDSPEIIPSVDRWGRCYVEFLKGYIVIWRVIREKKAIRSILAYRPVLIRVLGIEY